MKAFSEELVINDFSLEVGDGEFVALLGPSGCGKSTLLNVLAGEERADSGTVFLESDPCLVFQRPSLFWWLTVEGNVAFPLKVRGMRKKEWRPRVRDLIAEVGLGGFERFYPHQLSGGMYQRANLARALATDKDILLMDEPLGALDVMTRFVMWRWLEQLWQAHHKTIVLVTHQIEEAVVLADRILVLNPRPTSIKQEIVVDIPRPRDAFSDECRALYQGIFVLLGM